MAAQAANAWLTRILDQDEMTAINHNFAELLVYYKGGYNNTGPLFRIL